MGIGKWRRRCLVWGGGASLFAVVFVRYISDGKENAFALFVFALRKAQGDGLLATLLTLLFMGGPFLALFLGLLLLPYRTVEEP